MSKTIAVNVPDIGNFKDIPVIEILVKVGDTVTAEQSLITLETDKATMDVPAPVAGVVKELKLKVGDTVSIGSVILMLETSAAAPAASVAAAPASAPTPPPAPVTSTSPGQAASTSSGQASTQSSVPSPQPFTKGDIHAEVVVLGAGPGGYTAAFRAADLGKQVVLIEREESLGGVCLNVGCIPSKALLHVAKVITEAEEVEHQGVSFGKPKIDINKIRSWKESVIGKLTGGLAGLAKQRKVQVVYGVAKFGSANSLIVETKDGSKTITFDNAIIAAGSSVVRIPGFPYDDARLIDSTGALALADVPKRMLIIGGGNGDCL
jgi:dihydrolipoamide dehydrogenase